MIEVFEEPDRVIVTQDGEDVLSLTWEDAEELFSQLDLMFIGRDISKFDFEDSEDD